MNATNNQTQETGSWEDGLIVDGFRQDGYIAPVEGLYPELRFVFTPMFPEEVEVAHGQMASKPALEASILQARAIAKALASWNFSEGKPSENQVRRLRFAQQNKLFKIVSGQIPSDPDPVKGGGKLEGFVPLTETLGN